MRSKTILLVEDNGNHRALTEEAIVRSSLACQLVVAEDGNEAIDYLACAATGRGCQHYGLPALVLLSLKAGSECLQLLKRMRADLSTKRLPVVVLKDASDEEGTPVGLELGINSYIRKPDSAEEFTRTVQRICGYWLLLNEPPPEPNPASWLLLPAASSRELNPAAEAFDGMELAGGIGSTCQPCLRRVKLPVAR